MSLLADLWLPILASASLVFIVSAILHMVIPIHRGDYKKLPGEEKVLRELRDQGIEPGTYMFPCAGSMKEMCTPEMIEKYKLGPCGFMTVVPSGTPKMGKSLVQWFLFSVVISFFTAYIARFGLTDGAEFMRVFRVTGTVAILGYAVSYIPDSIWKGVGWCVTLKFIFDGVVYGLVTGAAFGWLWPGAM
jgi:hypothetical protein